MAQDYYKILEINKSASEDEIKKAYRKLALRYHPDRNGGEENAQKFKEINEAYQVLSDPQKRSQYDQFGSTFQGNQGGFDDFSRSGFSGDFGGFGFSSSGFGGLGDIFEDFFGQAFSTVNAEITISPSQAVLGDKIRINVSGEDLEINIPEGTQDGTTFRFQGKGKSYKNAKRGDLNITVRVEIPKRPTKEQKELWEQLREAESKKKSWWQH